MFVITADNKILLSQSVKNVVVKAECLFLTDSGSKDWHGQYMNTVIDVIRVEVVDIA